MNDDDKGFIPTPMRPAMPVRAEAELLADPNFRVKDDKALERKLRAKRAWQTRRANAVVEHTPDRHRTDVQLTVREAIVLAKLMVDYPFLRKLVE